jgi:hypothetical protein
MQKSQKGFIVPLLVIIVVIILIVVGIYLYNKGSNQNTLTGTSTPVTTTQTAPAQTGSQNPGTGTSAPAPEPISVPGMSEYTDASFGFSLWYPSKYQITQAPDLNNTITGATVIKKLQMNDGGTTMYEVTSPDLTVTDNSAKYGNETYFFSPATHEWMTVGHNSSTATAANVSVNTMGGLHIFSGAGGPLSYSVIIPLSAQHFLVIQNNTTNQTGISSLTKTVLALDPTVATPVSTAGQIQTITAEAQAYAVTQ